MRVYLEMQILIFALQTQFIGQQSLALAIGPTLTFRPV